MSKNSSPRKPRFRRVSKVAIQLQPRDKQIIYEVYKHRFLNTEHIRALIPGHYKSITRRLHLLYHSGYLDRPPEQIKPYKKGSDPMVYGLGNKGADLLSEEFQIPRGKVDWTSKNREAKIIFLEHTLMISHFMVCLKVALRGSREVRLMEGEELKKSFPQAKKGSDIIKWSVKVSTNHGGEKRQIKLSIVPDNFFGLHFLKEPEGQNKAFFFLEADRSTMPVKRENLFKSSYLKKIAGYWESWKQEVYKEEFGFKNPRVLTLTKSASRLENMIQAGKEYDEKGKGMRMFLFTEASKISLEDPGNIFDNIWKDGRGERASLLD